MFPYNRPVPVLFRALAVRPFSSLPGPVNKISQEKNWKYWADHFERGRRAVKTHSIRNDKTEVSAIF
jgi:hypothetical protein